MDRRAFLTAVGAGLASGAAGCLGGPIERELTDTTPQAVDPEQAPHQAVLEPCLPEGKEVPTITPAFDPIPPGETVMVEVTVERAAGFQIHAVSEDLEVDLVDMRSSPPPDHRTRSMFRWDTCQTFTMQVPVTADSDAAPGEHVMRVDLQDEQYDLFEADVRFNVTVTE